MSSKATCLSAPWSAFLTTTLGLGPVLAAAFPLVGAIAFTGVIVEGVHKFLEARDAAQRLGETIRNAFDEAISKERQHADELTLTNAKLDEEIAKLEHKPGNGLATGAAEAAVEFDKLDSSIHSALATAKALFEQENKIGIFARLTGIKGNDDVKDEVVGTQERVEGIRREHGTVIRDAQDRGNSPEHLAELQRLELTAIQDEYAKSSKRLQDKLKSALDQQYDAKQLGGTGKEFDPRINSLRGSLELQDKEQRTLGEQYYEGQRKPVLERDRALKENGDNGRKAEEEARKAREAQDKLAAAQRVFDDATAREAAAGEKARSEAQLAELDRAHKALLLSDETYYQARLSVQNNALEAERAAALAQQGDLNGQIDRLRGQKLTGNDAVERDAKVLELRAKLLALDGEIARVTGQEARNREQSAEAIETLTQKRVADADRQGSQLETTRGGGSTDARSKQLEDEYQRRRKELNAEFGTSNTPAVRDLDAQHTLDQDALQVRGAEESEAPGEAQRRAERQGIDAGQRRGNISSNEAQKERIALDAREADALEPLLAAYQRLAADGDLGAIGKVAELKERIAELKDPVNDVAAEVRGQLDSAFEHVFENIDHGKNALKEFGKALEGDVLKDLYRNAVQPGLQAGLGILIPNRQGQSLPQSPSLPQVGSAASGTRGTFGKLASSLFGGAGNSDKESGQQFKITIENKSSTPVQATSASGSFDSDAKTFVIHTILEDAVGGGLISHLFKG